ncbi:hypothetical protein R1sor_019827 [Riccia sorocarpa]|uniref:Uncharacterized protein n=1 Tax=Riccia sorocarpa TaxID=122646 RepID=A0ABD3IDL3_9MARC
MRNCWWWKSSNYLGPYLAHRYSKFKEWEPKTTTEKEGESSNKKTVIYVESKSDTGVWEDTSEDEPVFHVKMEPSAGFVICSKSEVAEPEVYAPSFYFHRIETKDLGKFLLDRKDSTRVLSLLQQQAEVEKLESAGGVAMALKVFTHPLVDVHADLTPWRDSVSKEVEITEKEEEDVLQLIHEKMETANAKLEGLLGISSTSVGRESTEETRQISSILEETKRLLSH